MTTLTIPIQNAAEPASSPESVSVEAGRLFAEHRDRIYRQTDRLFAGLMLFQWLAGIVAACVISPLAWSGVTSSVHPHVWAAVVLGALTNLFPATLAILFPGRTSTRYAISVGQALTSALLIHLTGGRIETHFHVFGSLAFLSFYRNWRVLVPATLVTAADHFLRGAIFPQSVYGTIAASEWRWLEHAGWVIFEDVFLVAACLRSTREMRQIARRSAEVEQARADAERARAEAERASELAVAASRAKSQFLANMSHEIRTPLNGVVGMAELLVRRGGLSDQQLRYAQVIRSSADALLALINDVLDFSKIEAGKLELSCVDTDVRDVVEQVVEMLAPKAGAKGLEFACQVHPDAATAIHGDPDRLRQVLVNLVNNAVKFTERGEVVVRVSPEPATVAGQIRLRFSVSDTGIGIPPDRVDRLFKSFSQVDASTTRRFGGTGLGLAIAGQLVELMGGKIGYEARDGRGSNFWFTACFAPAKGGSASGRALHASRLAAATAIRGMRVLAVDDHHTAREVLRDQLESWGFEVELAADGEEALRKLRAAAQSTRPFRLAVIDLLMPRMDGRALAAAVRADSLLAATAMIMITSMDNPFDAAEMRRAGFSASLTKPIRQSELFDAVVGAMMQRPGAVSSSTAVPTANAATTANDGLTGALAGISVLLAEDNEVNQEVAREVLSEAGCRVEVVGNGRLALAALQATRFDVVLMDCQMPEMDGFEATRQIRERERKAAATSRQPVIALTANAVEGDRQRCLEAGMDGYVTKPIDPAALVKAIRAVLPQQTGSLPDSTATPFAADGVDDPNSSTSTSAAVAVVPREPDSSSDPVLPLDVESLVKRCAGKASLAERLLRMFEKQLSEQLASIQQCLEARDQETLARLAHTIKGAAANLSAAPVRDAAAELEKLGRAADYGAAEAWMKRLTEESRRLVEYLPEAMRALPAAGQPLRAEARGSAC